MSPAPVSILGSEQRTMVSNHTGRDYRITISLPYAYSKSPDEGWPFHETPARWPVIYLQNANWYFSLVTDIVRIMAWCGSTTDAIVVGIGYPEVDDPIESFKIAYMRRASDQTPVRDAEFEQLFERRGYQPSPHGDAANFLKFLKNELIPTIDQEFRTDPTKRVLVGQSIGGTFSAYALFEEPGLFDTYIVGTGLDFADRYVFKQEEAYASEHKNLPAKVYIYAGELEESAENTTVTDVLRFAAILQGRNYGGLNLIRQVFPGLNHCEAVPPAFQAGLKFALKK